MGTNSGEARIAKKNEKARQNGLSGLFSMIWSSCSNGKNGHFIRLSSATPAVISIGHPICACMSVV